METLTTTGIQDRVITLQFSFTSLAAIPQFLEDLPEENRGDSEARRQLNNKGVGEDLTNGQFRGKMVDLRKLPAGLLTSDYELVGVWKQQRLGGWNKNALYWMVRFRFCHKNYLAEYWSNAGEQAKQDMIAKKPMLLGELITICELAFWQVRAWRNSFYRDGRIVPNAYAISLNFEGRQPLYEWEPPKEIGFHDLPPQHKPDAIFNIARKEKKLCPKLS